MKDIIDRIIKKKLDKNEIIFEKNIINTLFLNDCTLFFEKNIEDIEKDIDYCIKNNTMLVELSYGKYGDKELIKRICNNLSEEEIKKRLEEEYLCRFDNLNYDEIYKVLEEKNETSYSIDENIKTNEICEENFIEEKENEIENNELTFAELIQFGLKNGYVTYDMLEKIDFEEDADVFNLAEAYDILDDKGIRIEEK